MNIAGHALVYSGVKYRLNAATPEATTSSGAIKISGTIFERFTFINSMPSKSKKFMRLLLYS